ncbi:hypothetical protein PENCOP_c007G08571 [Penicillium coprophilum]|uniref:Uncharacterized protein n=1 Tax=Penicillium coprophilum TaxID=36646 RepID=A0A1V6UKM2_9EURO|nr:hypothetical protein PENCOP_c007G08571 [Penicillium coprophilum]
MDVRASLSEAFWAIPFNLYTAFLFTKSDFKTILAPTMCCVLAALVSPSDIQVSTLDFLSALANSFVWCWLNLFIFNIENQTRSYSIIEDQVNKKWRPIPSNRITLPSARMLRYFAILLCAIYSHYFGVSALAGLFLYFGFLYNNTNIHKTALARNVFCALAYAIMGLGADIVALRTSRHVSTLTAVKPLTQLYLCDWKELDSLSYQWLAVFSMVILSTIHVSDFPDIDGDIKLGRKTLPILVGISRGTKVTAYMIMGWSVFIAFPNFASATTFACGIFAMGMMVCYLLLRGQSDRWSRKHERAYMYYTIWLGLIAFAPILTR